MSSYGIVVTVIFSLKEEYADSVCKQLGVMVEDTRLRPGFRDVEIVRQNENATKVFLFEHWDDKDSYQNYVTWRTERGDMDEMGKMLTENPEIQIWTQRIAKKEKPSGG